MEVCDPLPPHAREKTDKRIEAAYAGHHPEDADTAIAELEADGVINRIVYNQVPPKVEYELSEYGHSLERILNALCDWGAMHIAKRYGEVSSVLEDSILNDKFKEPGQI